RVVTDAGIRALPSPRVTGRFYYGWIVLGVAALAMVGVLPARRQGLGLITETKVLRYGPPATAWSARSVTSIGGTARGCAGGFERRSTLRPRRPCADGVQELRRADENLAFRDRRRAERIVVEIVLGEDQERRAGLKDAG